MNDSIDLNEMHVVQNILKHTYCMCSVNSLLMYSMELSPYSEAAICSAIQVYPNHVCNQRVDYHVHKSPPQYPLLSQINPVHTIPSFVMLKMLLYEGTNGMKPLVTDFVT
jgi:hypothetical protein